MVPKSIWKMVGNHFWNILWVCMGSPRTRGIRWKQNYDHWTLQAEDRVGKWTFFKIFKIHTKIQHISFKVHQKESFGSDPMVPKSIWKMVGNHFRNMLWVCVGFLRTRGMRWKQNHDNWMLQAEDRAGKWILSKKMVSIPTVSRSSIRCKYANFWVPPITFSSKKKGGKQILKIIFFNFWQCFCWKKKIPQTDSVYLVSKKL